MIMDFLFSETLTLLNRPYVINYKRDRYPDFNNRTYLFWRSLHILLRSDSVTSKKLSGSSSPENGFIHVISFLINPKSEVNLYSVEVQEITALNISIRLFSNVHNLHLKFCRKLLILSSKIISPTNIILCNVFVYFFSMQLRPGNFVLIMQCGFTRTDWSLFKCQ